MLENGKTARAYGHESEPLPEMEVSSFLLTLMNEMERKSNKLISRPD